MVNVIGLLVGASLGALIARKRGGNRLDLLHFAGVFGIIGLIIGTFIGVFVIRGA